nr:MAG TPA: hypothetical protein [Caudoviricetes sp.]
MNAYIRIGKNKLTSNNKNIMQVVNYNLQLLYNLFHS